MKARMYDIYDGEKLIARLAADAAAKLIGTTTRSIYTAASGGYRLKRRYIIFPADDISKSVTQEFCKQWDKTRLEILHKGRAKI